MSILTINAFPTTATINVSYNEETITAIGSVAIEVDNGTVVSYEVVAEQCTTKTGTETVTADKTLEIILNYIGAVSVDTWVPSTGKASFPTHIAMLGKGGWREVSSIAERDAIPSARREAGMSVFVTSEAKLYILNEDLTTWSEFKAGSSDGIRKTSSFDDFIPLYNGEIVQYVGETTGNYIQGYFYKGTFIEGERVDIDTSSSVAMGLVITNIDNYKAYLSWLETKYSTTVESLTFECTGGPMVGVKINDGVDYVQVCDPSGVNDPSDTPAYYGGVFSWIGLSITNPSAGDKITVSIENTDPSDPSSYEWTPVAVENTIDRVRRVESFPALPERTNEIVQYIGNTTINYHHGYFYQSKYESIAVDTSHAGTLNVEVSDQTKFDFYVSWLEERYGGTLEWLKFENTGSYMIATYSNLVDGDYTAVYNPSGEPSTGDLYSGAFPSWVGLTFSNADSNTGNYLTVGVGGNPEDPNSYTWNQVFVQENYPVIDNVTSTSTTSALSANQGRVLQEQITHLKGIGRFLAVWSCKDGLPKTQPATLPYEYKTGDYYLVDEVIVPQPSSATISQTSGTGISADVDVSTLETFMELTEDEDLKFWYTDYLCVKTKTSDPADDSIVNVVNTDKFDALYQTQSQIPSSEIDYPDFYSIRIEMYTEYATIGTSMTNCYKVRLYRLYYNEDHTRTHHEQIDDGIISPVSEGKEALNALLNEEYGFELRGNLIVNPVIGGHQNNSFEITKSGTDEWTFGLADVDLSNYGIEMTGSGSADDVLTVEYTAATHNYRPVGTQYTGEASKTWDATEDTTVRESDVYVFDGTTWTLQYNSSAGAPVQDVQIHGDSKVVNKVANLLVAEQKDTIPTAAVGYKDRIIQYTGETNNTYTNGFFYKGIEIPGSKYVIDPEWHNPEGLTSITLDDALIQSQIIDLALNQGYTYVDGVEIAFSSATSGQIAPIGDGSLGIGFSTIEQLAGQGFIIEGTPNTNTYLAYDVVADPQPTYGWERVDVQPATDISGKVDKTTDASKVYGTDDQGNQTTYNVNDFGQIDNVAIHGIDQTITNKRVDLKVVEQENSLPTASEDLVGRIVQYTGTTNQNYTHGYFYECVALGTDPETYGWERINTQQPSTVFRRIVEE